MSCTAAVVEDEAWGRLKVSRGTGQTVSITLGSTSILVSVDEIYPTEDGPRALLAITAPKVCPIERVEKSNA